MEISDRRQLSGSPVQIYRALLTPEMFQQCIPGCTGVILIASPFQQQPQFQLTITSDLPGFTGKSYLFVIEFIEMVACSHMVIKTHATGWVSALQGICTLDLLNDETGTMLSYQAEVTFTGRLASIPDFVQWGMLKTGLHHFFHAFERLLSTSKCT